MKRVYFILILLLVSVQNKKEDSWEELIRKSKGWLKKKLSESDGVIEEIRITKKWIKLAIAYYKKMKAKTGKGNVEMRCLIRRTQNRLKCESSRKKTASIKWKSPVYRGCLRQNTSFY